MCEARMTGDGPCPPEDTRTDGDTGPASLQLQPRSAVTGLGGHLSSWGRVCTESSLEEQVVAPATPGSPFITGSNSGSLTFFFFFRITFTPSTDTMMLTFFFLMFLALNSYCKGEENKQAQSN